jgi:hypothetical protein
LTGLQLLIFQWSLLQSSSGSKQPKNISFAHSNCNLNNQNGSSVPLQAICLLYTSKLSHLFQTTCCCFPQTVILTSLFVSLQIHLCQYSNLCSSFIQFYYPHLCDCDTVTLSF